MSELGLGALGILILLLPGFLAARVVQSLCVSTEQSDLDKTVEALIYTFLIYVIFLQFGRPLPVKIQPVATTSSVGLNGSDHPGQVSTPMGKEKENVSYEIIWNAKSLLLLCSTSIGLALVISVVSNSDMVLTILRKLHFTQQTSRTS